MRSARSKTVTRWPARAACCAQASPAGPEPITATFFPVRRSGGCGATQPASQAWSMMLFSIALIVTGSLLMLRTHASSHGAGQTRPVNSGKLLVACSRWIASRQRLRYTRSFQSGMMFPSGQPLWQKGMPQSMQRAPCARSRSSDGRSSNSRQWRRRTATGSLCGASRGISRKPVIFPIASDRGEARRLGVEVLLGEHLRVLHGQYLDEPLARLSPAGEHPPRHRRARKLVVALDELAHDGVVALVERREAHHALVAAHLEGAVLVEHVGHATAHPRREVPTRAAEHHHRAPGHVLAAVVAHAFHHRGDPAVAHAEALARLPAEEHLPARRSVERYVAHDDVLLGQEGRRARRIDHHAAAREPLAEVVVGVALELDGDARREPGAEALPGGARELDPDRLRRQAVGAVA